MKVMKFGGTSVGTADRIKNVARLIIERGNNFIVLSAMSGTTNALVGIINCLQSENRIGAHDKISELSAKYDAVIDELFENDTCRNSGRETIKPHFDLLNGMCSKSEIQSIDEKEILVRGELISTTLMFLYLTELGKKVAFIPALDFMVKNSLGEPDLTMIKDRLLPLMNNHKDADLFLTQGFICRNAAGLTDNLERGGSDYTASLIGAAIDADEIEIWTDIDGMHNNDPRFVESTRPVAQLHFDEAAELAYFGAKILHPTCVLPAKVRNIPVRLLNTMEPAAAGTLIFNTPPTGTIKAVAAKDNITAIKIKSGRMLLAYGFLRKVFEIFETYRTPIDMIVTSEVGVSLTIDNDQQLDAILNDLKEFGEVTVDRDMVIICVVGDLQWANRGFEAQVVNALRDIPVRMISYGGSNYNISLLIRKSDKLTALNLLSSHLFS